MSFSNRDEESDFLLCEALTRFLIPGSPIIDVGAHEGEFLKSIPNIEKFEVYAFEPLSNSAQVLKIALPSVKVINSAVGKTNGIAKFYENVGSVGSSLLEPSPAQSSAFLTPKNVLEVKITRLDNFILQNNIKKISLLKTDAQGLDNEVIKSAGIYLNPNFIESLLCEVSFHEFYIGQNKYYEIMKTADEAGYFLAGFFPHFNRKNWLWWADVLFLPKNEIYSTNILP